MRALEADLWTRHGLIEGTGPWAGLKNHPRRLDLAETIEEDTAAHAATNARDWTVAPFEYPDRTVHDAMRNWVEAYGALRDRALQHGGQHESPTTPGSRLDAGAGRLARAAPTAATTREREGHAAEQPGEAEQALDGIAKAREAPERTSRQDEPETGPER